MRHAYMQLTSIHASAQVKKVSITSVMLGIIPFNKTLTVENEMMCLFLRTLLRTTHLPSDAYTQHQCETLTCAGHNDICYDEHTYACGHAGWCRIRRHDDVARILLDLKSCKWTIMHEPRPPPGAGDNTKPDLQFRLKDTTPGASPTPTSIYKEWQSLDVTIGKIMWTDIEHKKCPRADRHVWLKRYKKKVDKHNNSGHDWKCLPFCITTHGAIDPEAVEWLAESCSRCSPKKKPFDMIRRIVFAVRRRNMQGYRHRRQNLLTNLNTTLDPPTFVFTLRLIIMCLFELVINVNPLG